MALDNSVSVRFSEETNRRLEAIAERSPLTKADLVRIATEDYLDRIEKTGEVPLRLREVPPHYRAGARK